VRQNRPWFSDVLSICLVWMVTGLPTGVFGATEPRAHVVMLRRRSARPGETRCVSPCDAGGSSASAWPVGSSHDSCC